MLAATFLGGAADDRIESIDLDSAGNVYVAGRSDSWNLPISPDAWQTNHFDAHDVFVAMFDPGLSNLLACTFLGGSEDDEAREIAVAADGSVYVAGRTDSADFPVVTGCYDTVRGNWGADAFVAKLDASLSNLVAATFLGGDPDDEATALAVDGGNVYVSGETEASGFPTTTNAHDRFFNGFSRWTDYALQADIKLVSGSVVLNVNHSDRGQHAVILWESGQITVGKWENADFLWTNLASTSGVGLTTGQWHNVAVSTSNGTIVVQLDDTEVLSARDPAVRWFHGGTIALQCPGGDSDVYVNNVSAGHGTAVFWEDDFDDGDTYGWNADTWGPNVTDWSVVDVDGRQALRGVGGEHSWLRLDLESPESDGFLSKLDGNLRNLLASTFLGGARRDEPNAVSLDHHGNLYVGGQTQSPDFPTTSNAYDNTFNGNWMQYDVSLHVKIVKGTAQVNVRHASSEGSWHRYMVHIDTNSVSIDKEASPMSPWRQLAWAPLSLSTGRWYEVGITVHEDGLGCAIDGSNVLGAVDGDRLVIGALSVSALGGEEGTWTSDVYFDDVSVSNRESVLWEDDFEDGDASDWYVPAGWEVVQENSNHVLRARAYFDIAFPPWDYRPCEDAFVAKFDGSLADILASTFLGENDEDGATALATHTNGNVYAAGWTWSPGFPTTPGTYDQVFPRGHVAFVSTLNANLDGLVASTVLGSGGEIAEALALDGNGSSIYVAGSSWGSLPTTYYAFDGTHNGSRDAFAAKLTGALTELTASTYVGGGAWDEAFAVRLDSHGNVYVAGVTESADFPATNAFDAVYHNDGDGFVCRLDGDLSRPPRPDIRITPTSHDFGHVFLGQSSTQRFSIANVGRLDLQPGTLSVVDGGDASQFALTNDGVSGVAIPPGATGTVDVVFSPTTPFGKAAVLVIPSNDPDTPTNQVPVYGSGRDTGTAEVRFHEGLAFLAAFNTEPHDTNDLLNADARFQQALAADPGHYGACVYGAGTRLTALACDDEINDLLSAYGMPEAGRDIWNWSAEFPDTMPTNCPRSGEALALVRSKLLPAIDDALDYLGRIPTNWSGSIVCSPVQLPIDNEVQVDAGDIQMFRFGLDMLRTPLLAACAHDLDAESNDIDNLGDETVRGFLRDYPRFGTITNAAYLTAASNSLVSAMGCYLSGSALIRAETDYQTDDLIILDPEELDAERRFRLGVEQLRDSLLGRADPGFTVEIGQFLNLGDFFDDPIAMRELLSGAGSQRFLTDKILFQIDWALGNLAKAGQDFNELLAPTNSLAEKEVEIDFGDVCLASAQLSAAKSAIHAIGAYNVDVDIVDIATSDPLVINSVITNYPDLLTVTDNAHMPTSWVASIKAIDSYLAASDFVRNETDDQTNDLFVIETEDLADEAELRSTLQDFRLSMFGPVLMDTNDLNEFVHVGRFFATSYVTRAHLPEFTDDNEIIAGTFPDPTFNGIFPDFTQSRLAEVLDIASISGTVLDAAGGGPLANVTVRAETPDRATSWSATTTADGAYAIALPPGSYKVSAKGGAFGREYWPEKPFFDEADVVTAGVAGNIDFTLAIGGEISGHVCDTNGLVPIAGCSVYAEDFGAGAWTEDAQTDSNGVYSLILPAGSYRVRAYPVASGLDYVAEWYDGVRHTSAATELTVSAAATNSGIDFALQRGGTVSGRVRESAGWTPVPGCLVSISDYYTWQWVADAETDRNGDYAVVLPPGTYTFRASPSAAGLGYLDEYYDGVYAEYQVTPVSIGVGDRRVGVDFDLDERGWVSGHIYEHDGVTPVSNVYVYAEDAHTGEWIRGTGCDHDGRYLLGLPSGTYVLRAMPEWSGLNFANEWYDGAFDREDATEVTVAAPGETTNIDFTLEEGARISGTVLDAAGGPVDDDASGSIELGPGWHKLVYRHEEHEGGQAARAAFKAPGDTEWRLLATSNLDVRVTADAGAQAGIMLVTRRNTWDDSRYPENHDDLVQCVDADSTADSGWYGTGIVRAVDQWYNLHGDNDYYVSYYECYFLAASTGTWHFSTDSDDASEIVIGDQVVAAWYGGHGPADRWEGKFEVRLNRHDTGEWVASDRGARDGSYAFDNLPPGAYILEAVAPGYPNEFYQEAWQWDDATPVVVAPGDHPADVDFTLDRNAAELLSFWARPNGEMSSFVGLNQEVMLLAHVTDPDGIGSVSVSIESPDEASIGTLDLFDDGFHNDGVAGDGWYGNSWWTPVDREGAVFLDVTVTDAAAVGYNFNNAATLTIDAEPPLPPKGLTNSGSGAWVALSWLPNTEPDLSGYSVYRDGVRYVAPFYSLGYTQQVQAGKSYVYNVTAIDTARNESPFSESVSVTLFPPPPTIESPADGQQFADTKIRVVVTTDRGAMVRAFVNGAPGGTCTECGFWSTWHWLTGIPVVEGTNVITVFSVSEYGLTNPVSDSVTVTVDYRPQPPGGLSATPGDTVVTLQWDAGTEPDLQGYNVYRLGPWRGWRNDWWYQEWQWYKLNAVPITGATYTDTRLTNGKTYHYIIKAVDTNGSESKDDGWVGATPIPGPEWGVP